MTVHPRPPDNRTDPAPLPGIPSDPVPDGRTSL